MFQSQPRSRSISDACADSESRRLTGFNLNREAAPLATLRKSVTFIENHVFQSQPRSRSISDSEPSNAVTDLTKCFNLNREAAPLATMIAIPSWLIALTFQSQPRSRSISDP